MSIIVEILNYTVIAFGFVAKVPQLTMLHRNKNVAGLSMKSTVTELIAFLIIMSYCAKQRYDLSGYMEIISAVVQTVVLLLMMLFYDNKFTATNLAPLVAILSAFYSFYLGIPLDNILEYLVAGVSVVLASSKIFQLKEILNTKNSENVSITRWLLVSYISIARFITNLLGVADKALLLNSGLAFVLNMAIVIVAYHYRRPTSQQKGKKKN
ncbi:unnamed protein product [Allacma fusca]|uniref:Mannose-P-dolichol utilization defect 1 protein homolog n=1 Tax=Allacma fusca TaxID=39272 RepID=A0A8J2J7Z9_9HEXA|nr:unnamed protein product [Allacma fusca]